MNRTMIFYRVLVTVLSVVSICAQSTAHPSPGIVCTNDGTIYFVIGPTHELWKINTDGKASVLVSGGLDQEFRVPHHLFLDREGNIYTASDAGSFVWKITSTGEKSRIYPPMNDTKHPTVGNGGDPFTLTADGDIIAVFDDRGNNSLQLVRIQRDGNSRILAGGARGRKNGKQDAAQFESLDNAVLAWGSDGALLFVDAGKTIRRVTLDGEVTTVFDAREANSENAEDAENTIHAMVGIAMKTDGMIYAADFDGHRIWSITPAGKAVVLAGTGKRGSADGSAGEATFDEPVGLTFAPDGALLVLEQTWDDVNYGTRVRRIHDGRVTTVCDVKSTAQFR